SELANRLKLMVMPTCPECRIKPYAAGHSMVIDFEMTSVPNEPESRQSTSPPTMAFCNAPLNVRQGAVRLQGLTSSPTPETQVRWTCAAGGVGKPHSAHQAARRLASTAILSFMSVSPLRRRNLRRARSLLARGLGRAPDRIDAAQGRVAGEAAVGER